MVLSVLKKIYRTVAVFCIGAFGYYILEILWRGHSHWVMALTGGVCFSLIYILNLSMRDSASVAGIAAVSCGIITAAELVVGMVVNVLLGWNVWDYSSLFMNVAGQICLYYTLLWFLLSVLLVYFCRFLSERVFFDEDTASQTEERQTGAKDSR